jgi:hypothetical protein
MWHLFRESRGASPGIDSYEFVKLQGYRVHILKFGGETQQAGMNGVKCDMVHMIGIEASTKRGFKL